METQFFLRYHLPFANSGENDIDGLTSTTSYAICTPQQLNSIASVPAHLNKSYKIKADLDLSVLTANSYQIIGFTGAFTGTIDGQNFTIRNLTYTSLLNDCVALICSANSATVKDLTLENFNLTGRNYTSALASFYTNGSISNVKSSGIISGTMAVAGLVGSSNVNISNSSSSATIIASGSAAGGLIAFHNSGNITRCFATGNVSASSAVGGLTSGSYGGLISESYATGNVSATVGDIAGGLVGSLWTNMSMVYATGTVSGRDYVGGLVGDFAASIVADCYATGNINGREWIGGLIGHFYNNSLSRCYSSGNVTGTGQQVGSFIGLYQAGNASNSFSVGSVSGNSASNYIGLFHGQYLSGIRTNLFYNSSAACFNSSGVCNAFGTAINVLTNPTYFFNSANPPLDTWDFTTIWKTSGSSLPTFKDF